MQNRDEEFKEIYAEYGLSLHFFQMVERGLLELIALSDFVKEGTPPIVYYQLLANKKNLTFGRFLKEAKERNLFSEKEFDVLKLSNISRNKLAHSFWWETEIKEPFQENFQKIQENLLGQKSLAIRALEILDNKITYLRRNNGITLESDFGLVDFSTREAFIKNLK